MTFLFERLVIKVMKILSVSKTFFPYKQFWSVGLPSIPRELPCPPLAFNSAQRKLHYAIIKQMQAIQHTIPMAVSYLASLREIPRLLRSVPKLF